MYTPVYIGFSTPKKFSIISWIVREFTKSKCSHVWIMFYGPVLGLNVIIEAHELGFRLISYDLFKNKNKIVAMINPSWPMDEAIKFQVSWLGSRYDFGGLLGMAVVILGRLLGIKTSNPLQNSRAMFCSESIVSALQKVGYPGSEVLVPHNTSPQDLLDFFENSEEVIMYDAV